VPVINLDKVRKLRSLKYNGNCPTVCEAYKKDLEFKDIVKLVRQKINETYPKKAGWKISVTQEHFRGGRAIDVKVNAAPFELREQSPDHDYPILNKQAKELKKSLQTIVDLYNFDGSDTQTDYFYNNYYTTVSL